MPSTAIPVDPANLSLRPEERLISAYTVPSFQPARQLKATEALQLMAGVDRREDIGKNGPVVASRALTENQEVNELHRYEVLFGRDSLIVSWFVFDQFPELARATVKQLAQLQGTSYHTTSEEEPGEIVHEVRKADDPIAQHLTARYGWRWPFYGSIDATPLFIRSVIRYVREQTPNLLREACEKKNGQQQTMEQALWAALSWVIAKLDETSEGLLESHPLSRGGPVNQAWKDSPDSYHHADGRLANRKQGVASIEVQTLAYDALCDMVELLRDDTVPCFASPETVAAIAQRAQKLREVLLNKFWVEDDKGGYFALGSDRHAKSALDILPVRSSNMGHVLDSRLLDGNDPGIVRKKEMLVNTLLSPDMLSSHGIRTLSERENRYRPNSYHNGSVWPWDTFKISLGLLRHGYRAEAESLWEKINRVIAATKRFPEFVSGENSPSPLLPDRVVRVYDTHHHFEHAIEQPPQDIQAWTVAAAVAIESLTQK